MTRGRPACLICGSATGDEDLPGDPAAQVVRCPTCGTYAIETRLSEYLSRAHREPRPHVLKLLPGLQRAIRAATARNERAHLTLEHWEADARDHF